ncbi:MAG: 4-hydroxy-3-methylbut-2-enyl diphosphate reductase [Deltaproteobacteria bacterium]|nr:MAG: 4-hydroxy-3-methylbut-2-enyl diphosphate reductase [Deltaproteobacteria bacterium]
MRIVRSSHIGLCFGVKRAIRVAMEHRSRHTGPMYSLGPLLHNPQEVRRLEKAGIIVRDELEKCADGPTLVRTHGITRQQLEKARTLGIELVDAVCPRVEVVRRHMEEYGRRGYLVVLAGDAGHPEVIALRSYAKGPVVVVSRPDQLPERFEKTPVVVLSQTTKDVATFDAIVMACRQRCDEVEQVRTICSDAVRRQADGARLARNSDMVIVIGGRNSANTTRLAEICRRIQPRTHHIEDPAELKALDFRGVETIGLASGASTPDWLVDDVERQLRLAIG